MNGITKEQIEQARRVGILAYMRAYEPQELVKASISIRAKSRSAHALPKALAWAAARLPTTRTARHPWRIWRWQRR